MKSFFTALLATAAYGFSVQDLITVLTPDDGYVPITIKEDGVDKTLYIAAPFWFTGVGGNELQLPYGGRAYLTESASLSPESFYRPNLLGGTVEYDVDMSQMTCGCIAAFYMVRMPAKDQSGNYDQTDGFYYCDAQAVGGQYCPEFDIMEANQYAYQTTAHSCDSPSGGHYWNCDHGGSCVQNSVELWNHQGKEYYGPGDQFTINTLKEFHVKFEFQESNGQFQSFQTTLSQEGRTAVKGCNDGSNNKMTDDIQNMGFAISSWGSPDANWLWKDSCGGTCGDPTLTYKNIVINTGGAGPSPGPSPTPSDYVYGDSCATAWDYDCDGSCDCRWSWPSTESYDGPDAHCRCKP